MNIQAEKLRIMKMILETDNPTILESIKNLFVKQPESDFWTTLPENEKEDILKGIEELEKGEVVNYDDFIARHR
ncbi:hypothetical protein [uncultured Marivirga sp.]|uniref:hypothetical protein n=1 Tax=uncultured Marivirga sp. TaxID=1123707 RepID=UPI0030EDAFC8|tara:strand:+ start:343485 stop:343706 length:222 start_codon:yes stop_codon:yes gene_type:complete